MSDYDDGADYSYPPAPKRKPGSKFEYGEHEFIFNRETRRMVCVKCGGVMNECPKVCSGKRA